MRMLLPDFLPHWTVPRWHFGNRAADYAGPPGARQTLFGIAMRFGKIPGCAEASRSNCNKLRQTWPRFETHYCEEGAPSSVAVSVSRAWVIDVINPMLQFRPM